MHKGQLLVKLEAPEIEQQYYSAKAKYLQVYAMYLASKDDYDRLLVANKLPGTVSAHDLELARAKKCSQTALPRKGKWPITGRLRQPAAILW